MSREPRAPHIRIVPDPPAPAADAGGGSHATLRRTVEQVLSAHPRGLPWRVLWEDVARRRVAEGFALPTRDDVVRCLGAMLVQGRVDEHDGRFALRVVAPSRPRRLSA